jgi:hypothetical protein
VSTRSPDNQRTDQEPTAAMTAPDPEPTGSNWPGLLALPAALWAGWLVGQTVWPPLYGWVSRQTPAFHWPVYELVFDAFGIALAVIVTGLAVVLVAMTVLAAVAAPLRWLGRIVTRAHSDDPTG